MATGRYGDAEPTSMGNARDDRALRRDSQPEVASGAGELHAGSLHARGAGGDGTPLAGGTARPPEAAVHGDRGEDGSVDRDRDAGGALAEPRRGRLSAPPPQGQTDQESPTNPRPPTAARGTQP